MIPLYKYYHALIILNHIWHPFALIGTWGDECCHIASRREENWHARRWGKFLPTVVGAVNGLIYILKGKCSYMPTHKQKFYVCLLGRSCVGMCVCSACKGYPQILKSRRLGDSLKSHDLPRWFWEILKWNFEKIKSANNLNSNCKKWKHEEHQIFY